MDNVDDLLDEALTTSYAGTTPNEEHIVIGRDRFITVPEPLKKIAVQGDCDVETVTFDCPRYWDEHDFSTMNVYVDFRRPDGQCDKSICTDISVDATDDSIIHFNWKISHKVASVPGTLSIKVSIKKSDDEPVCWNSELCTDMYVSNGMEIDSEIIEDNSDIINELFTKADNIVLLNNEKIEEYNSNATAKTAEFNQNAENKLSQYNSNATTKTSEYNSNSTAKTEEFNQNVTNKLSQYNSNATTKTSEFDQNASTKLSEYNDNAEDKIYEYNVNAESKISELNSTKADVHNNIWGGRNITSKGVVSIAEQIASGDFTDLYIGDYFTLSISGSVTKVTDDTAQSINETIYCYLAGFDTYYQTGDSVLNKHHAVIVTKFANTSAMNPTNTTTGAYYNSVLHTRLLPEYADMLKEQLGDHLLTYRHLFANTVSTTASNPTTLTTGASSNWEWYVCTLRLMNEHEVYGSYACSCSRFDVGIANSQLPLFRINHSYVYRHNGSRLSYWLSNVVSTTNFASVNSSGYANNYYATYSYYVRPCFLLG